MATSVELASFPPPSFPSSSLINKVKIPQIPLIASTLSSATKRSNHLERWRWRPHHSPSSMRVCADEEMVWEGLLGLEIVSLMKSM